MNKDNIISAVTRMYTTTKISPKTSNEYSQLIIEFSNGYVYSGFLNAEQKKLIEYAILENSTSRAFLDDSPRHP